MNYFRYVKKLKNLLVEKSPKNSPRECDIDILDYAKKSQNDKVCLPHPMLHKRNFVLIPLFEIEKIGYTQGLNTT